MTTKTFLAAALTTASLASGIACADPITWTDWSAGEGGPQGTIGSVGLTFTATGGINFLQDGVTGNLFNYFQESYGDLTYTGSPTVDNGPTPAEMVSMNAASDNTVLFDESVSNLLMAIVSMGQSGLPVTYDFGTTEFSVLSFGRNQWGYTDYQIQGNTILIGREFNGVIQFEGDLSELSWTSTGEYWHGFTLGVVSEVPEPATLALFGLGLAGIGFSRRKKA